jgi:hypothetical protein
MCGSVTFDGACAHFFRGPKKARIHVLFARPANPLSTAPCIVPPESPCCRHSGGDDTRNIPGRCTFSRPDGIWLRT